jgi:ketosteroid isomerase-like protein
MKKSILATLTLAVLIAGPIRADEDASKEVEKAIGLLNTAFQKRDAKAIKSLMTADHIAVTGYYGGPRTRDEQIKALPDFDLKVYKAEKMQVSLVGKDTALVTYTLTMKGTYNGKDVPAKNFASAVWVRRDGKWVERFYQETPLRGK